ncbi:restriction endonuclease [bacterium]|nr:restriction endonuclease [bacterium]
MLENALYYGDNLHILKEHIPDNSIDLIYLDPPFNSKADYNILFKEPSGELSHAQITAFEDTWHWTIEVENTFEEIQKTAARDIVGMMQGFRDYVIGKNDLMAYLTMMCIRLIELKRVLKDTGSLYLHCDPTASHYLKIVMDTIFGKKNFRNEIIWCYKRWPAKQKNFQKMHDIILRFSKTNDVVWNQLYDDFTDQTKKRIKGGKKIFTFIDEFGKKKIRPTDEQSLGVPMCDYWNIHVIAGQAKERLGYPTQKPEALLERIIKASSNEGNVVLDPFCGCGTTIAASQKLNRKWIGIDITHLAINLMKHRLRDMHNLEPKSDYNVIGEPEDFSGAIELANSNRYQFQWWVLSLINGIPYQDKKKGSDTGIDGFLRFIHQKGKYKDAIVQVKSGNVSVKDIRDLGHVIDREKAEIGIFITLKDPTTPMKTEAAQKGLYESEVWGKNYPRIQILTIEELFNGKKPEIPGFVPMHKQAQKTDIGENGELSFK